MEVLLRNAGFILRGFGLNCVLVAIAIPLALPLGCALALARLSRVRVLYLAATAYVNVLRSSPLLMVMFWLYFLAPLVLGRQTGAFYSAAIALTLFEAAYFAEIIRGGIQSVEAGQARAALAAGLRPWQAAAYVVVPQAVQRMLPALATQSIVAFQDTTLASVIGVLEVAQTANVIMSREGNPVALYSMLAALYLVVCYTLSLGVRRLERRAV